VGDDNTQMHKTCSERVCVCESDSQVKNTVIEDEWI